MFLRKSTQTTIAIGPFLDSVDANTEKTGLTIAYSDIKLHKAGATSMAAKESGGGGATHMANGIYHTTLTTGDTNTAGPLLVYCHMSGALAVRHQFIVLDADAYDALVAGSGYLRSNVLRWNGSNVATPDTAGYPKVTLKSGTGAGEVSLASGVAQADVRQVMGSSVNVSSAQLGVNVVNWKGATAPAMSGDSYAVLTNGTYGLSALNNDIDAMAGIVGLLEDWIKNKLEVIDNGNGTYTIKLYADNGSTVLLTWTYNSATGLRSAAS